MLALPSFKNIACLLISSDKKKRRLLADVLNQIGIGKIHETDTVEHAILQLRYVTIDLVIWAEAGDGHIELLRRIRRELPTKVRSVPFLCVTEGWDNDRLTQARDAGASAFATLPLTLRGMLKAVSALLGDPREFIDCGSYAGPDRRRNDLPNYRGPRRRSSDGASPRPAEAAPPKPPPSVRPEDSAALQGGGNAGSADRPTSKGATGIGMASGGAAHGADIQHLPPSNRRVQVVQEALRISQELQALLHDPTAENAKAKISDNFNRLMNLMGLVHGYCREEGEAGSFFKKKYAEIMGTVSKFSFGILASGLERTVQESSKIVDGTSPAALGSSSKIFYKMSEFDTLITMLGGYPSLSIGLLEMIKTGWQNVLSLAAIDTALGELEKDDDSQLKLVASRRLNDADTLLQERRAADSQEAAFQRLNQSPPA
jgi:CheY-like chemotaxis protein